VRTLPTLLADVSEFMTLQPGDVLMVGSDCLADGTRPRAQPGDQIDITAPGFDTVTTRVRSVA
jgi:5-oxopent-3-ene-1,2,5-tricarboxylate decarboxylase/2-hydroxyhepta-2,4-diene-1,7-dioate isomerase